MFEEGAIKGYLELNGNIYGSRAGAALELRLANDGGLARDVVVPLHIPLGVRPALVRSRDCSGQLKISQGVEALSEDEALARYERHLEAGDDVIGLFWEGDKPAQLQLRLGRVGSGVHRFYLEFEMRLTELESGALEWRYPVQQGVVGAWMMVFLRGGAFLHAEPEHSWRTQSARTKITWREQGAGTILVVQIEGGAPDAETLPWRNDAQRTRLLDGEGLVWVRGESREQP